MPSSVAASEALGYEEMFHQFGQHWPLPPCPITTYGPVSQRQWSRVVTGDTTVVASGTGTRSRRAREPGRDVIIVGSAVGLHGVTITRP
jgi:hypothetical protein